MKGGIFFKILSILFISFLVSCKSCKEPFKRNPNLELILKNDWDSFFNPIWSPDGKYIYYLRAHRDNLPTFASELGIGGELWRINLETRENKFLLKGPFSSLAISPRGDLLALSYEKEGSEIEWDGGPLILVDTSGKIIDTLLTSLPNILDVEFSGDGTKLYYYTYSSSSRSSAGFFSINLDGSGEQIVKEDREILGYMKWGLNFTLKRDDTLIYGKIDSVAYRGMFYKPQIFYKENTPYIIFCTDSPFFTSELKLLDVKSHTFIFIDANPYAPPQEIGGFESAYWSPDGEKLVLSVGKVEGGCPPARVMNLEIWILHKIW